MTYRATSTAFYDAVVDAASGAVLYRQNLVKAAANAEVYPNHPGASPTETVDLEDYGLPAGSTNLDGNWSKQWADVDDDDVADAAERTPPSAGTNFVYPFTPFTPGANCPTTEPCAWNPAVRNSWQTNRDQNAVQAFYLVSRFHDHLAGDNVAFTDDSGNFEVGGTGGDDPVLTQTDDGADTEGDGGPDVNHKNNANMGTPPDGQSPTMQMYLFEDSGATDALDFRSINGGDDSGVVWHEYTHGLSNRLVTNADGAGALSTAHSGAMGEAWSDWYASDLQVADGLKTDAVGTPAEIDVGDYSDLDPHALRTPGARLPGRGRRRGLPRRRGHRHRRLHARRLRQGRRRARGPRRRRDLGRDAVGPAPGAPGQDRQRGRRLRHRGDPRLRRHAGLAARAVDARHAQRDPDRGADRLRRRDPRPRVGRVPQARHGLLRRHGRRRGHEPGRGLPAAAGPERPQGHGHRRRHRLRLRPADRGRARRLRRPRVAARVRRLPRRRDRRGRALHDRGRADAGPTRSSRSSRPRATTRASPRNVRDRHRRDDDAQHPADARLVLPERRRRGPERQRRHRRPVRLRRQRRPSTSRRARAGPRTTRPARTRGTRRPARRRP